MIEYVAVAEATEGVPVIAQVTVLKLRPDGRAGEMEQDVTEVPVEQPNKFAVIAVPTT